MNGTFGNDTPDNVQPFGLWVSSGACPGVSSQSLLHSRPRTSQPFGLNVYVLAQIPPPAQGGVETFTDDSLPSNASPCTYQITAVRSTARGNPAQFTVNFGMGGAGGLTITSVTETPVGDVKLAV